MQMMPNLWMILFLFNIILFFLFFIMNFFNSNFKKL